MNEIINVQEILKNSAFFWGLDEEEKKSLSSAIKEICEAVVDKCAEEAKLGIDINPRCPNVSKSSILNVKTLINY